MNRTHQAIFLALMMTTMSLAGCFGGDDGGSNEDETPVETLDDWQVHFANSVSDLPECDDDRSGWLYYVSADENFQVCTEIGWELVDITGPSGADGTNGVDGQNGADGSNGTDGLNGADGQDGTSILINVVNSTACLNGGNTFEIGSDDNADGFLSVTEVAITVDICNGAQGPEGPQGPAGADGQDGADGAQGPAGANGTDGQDGAQGPQGPAGANGTDGQDGAQGPQGPAGANGTDGQDGAQGPQGPAGANGTDGQDGAQGPQGPAGANGTDGQDGAQGPQGPAGANGTDGQDGSNGLNALVSMTPEPSGSNCANGGTRIDVGVDDNSNGVLEASEIDQTQYVCDGGSSNNTMLTSVSGAPANLGCNVAGRVISHGLDNGDGGGIYANGVLESGEIDSSTTFCTRLDYNFFKEINTGSSGSASSNPSSLTAVQNTLYFSATTSSSGTELWKSDGTVSGTVMVKDIVSGTGSSSPAYAVAVGNTVYFRACDTNGCELWKSDGTATGTVMVKDISSGSVGSNPNSLTAVGNTLYFRADDGTNGYELWKSDGTASGTVMVKDINSGSSSSNPI